MDNELFDLRDPEVSSIYRRVSEYQEAELTASDERSFSKIIEGIHSAAANHPGDGLILLSGAYTSIIGATVQLARRKAFNVRYVPLTLSTFSTKQMSPEALRLQMNRAIGLTKHFEFENMELLAQWLNELPQDPEKRTLTVLGLNQTSYYFGYQTPGLGLVAEEVYRSVRSSLVGNRHRPAFAFFSLENVSIPGVNRALLNSAYPRLLFSSFVSDMEAASISVEKGTWQLPEELKGINPITSVCRPIPKTDQNRRRLRDIATEAAKRLGRMAHQISTSGRQGRSV